LGIGVDRSETGAKLTEYFSMTGDRCSRYAIKKPAASPGAAGKLIRVFIVRRAAVDVNEAARQR
jgi:hypothetical protein